jgi:hypothetical protein
MYKKSLPASCLAPLSALEAGVARHALRCAPDYVCEMPRLREEVHFDVINMEDYPAAGLCGEEVSVSVAGTQHLLTDWSRLQLLGLLGTREKWFKRVTLEDQARELNRRVHCFHGQRLRLLGVNEPIGFVRGIVSQSYADIPNGELMRALVAAMPDGEYLVDYSGLSETNLYAYTLLREAPLGVDRMFTGYPGVIVRNSEVGANALWVIPFFVSVGASGRLTPCAVRGKALLRKVHRGDYGDLHEALTSALSEVKSVWAPLQQKLRALRGYTFADEAEAIDRLRNVLSHLRVSQRFVERCTTTYCAAHHAAHHGLALFTAVLETCATSQLDTRYDDAAVAGSVLLQLL